MKDIDLPPHQWKSERRKPHEPLFGPGLPIGVAVVVGIFVAAYFTDANGNTPILASFGAAIASGLILSIYR